MAVCGTLLLVFCILGQNVTRSITSPKLLTLSRAAPSAVSKVRGGGQIWPPQVSEGIRGFWIQFVVGTSYFTKNDTRQKDLQLSDT